MEREAENLQKLDHNELMKELAADWAANDNPRRRAALAEECRRRMKDGEVF